MKARLYQLTMMLTIFVLSIAGCVIPATQRSQERTRGIFSRSTKGKSLANAAAHGISRFQPMVPEL